MTSARTSAPELYAVPRCSASHRAAPHRTAPHRTRTPLSGQWCTITTAAWMSTQGPSDQRSVRPSLPPPPPPPPPPPTYPLPRPHAPCIQHGLPLQPTLPSDDRWCTHTCARTHARAQTNTRVHIHFAGAHHREESVRGVQLPSCAGQYSTSAASVQYRAGRRRRLPTCSPLSLRPSISCLPPPPPLLARVRPLQAVAQSTEETEAHPNRLQKHNTQQKSGVYAAEVSAPLSTDALPCCHAAMLSCCLAACGALRSRTI